MAWKMIRRGVVAVVAALATLLPTASSASAYGVTVTHFRNYATGVGCLDYRSDVGVYTTGCNSGDYQRWIWNNTPGIATPMRQVATQKCLELIETSTWWYPGMRACDSTNRWQRWYVRYPSGGGIPFIVSALDDTKCLLGREGGNTAVITYCGPDEPKERWVVTSL